MSIAFSMELWRSGAVYVATMCIRIAETQSRFGFVSYFVLVASLSGCGVVAAPCRVGSGVIKAVPLVGDVAAAPTDTCANVIDPDSISRS